MDDAQVALDLSIKKSNKEENLEESTKDETTGYCTSSQQDDETDICQEEDISNKHLHGAGFSEETILDGSADVGKAEQITVDEAWTPQVDDVIHSRKRRCTADLRNRPCSSADDITPGAIIRTVNGVSVRLQEEGLWHSFRILQTEMIINRGGRRMFPHIIVTIEGLGPEILYSVAMEIIDADDRRYKYVNNKWLAMGIADPGQARHVYVHPDSPTTGSEWAKSFVSFSKVRLTNNKESKESILLHSMHKYKVVITVKEESNSPLSGRNMKFDFPETTFIAVTAYQNNAITQLKIQNNPFAKAFRDVTVASKRTESVPGRYSGRHSKNPRVQNIFPQTNELTVPQVLLHDRQMLPNQQTHLNFAMSPGLRYGFYGNSPSPYIPWLNLGLGYPLPSMIPMWYSDRRHCPPATEISHKNLHKSNLLQHQEDTSVDKAGKEDYSSDSSISVE